MAEQDRYKKLAGNTVIFAISNFSSKLLSLFIQPFLTYAMKEVQEVGVTKLTSQCANLLIPLVSLGTSFAVIRFGLDRANNKKQVFTSGLVTILMGFVLMLLAYPIIRLLPVFSDYAALLYVYVLVSCLRTLCTQFVRSRQLNRLVAIDGILCTGATLLFYVLFLVVKPLGATGYLLAIICGDGCSTLFVFCAAGLWRYIDFHHFNQRLWRAMLRYALPMIPAQISFWIINASDLFFVAGMMGDEGTYWSGLLGTGYFLPTILTTLGTIFYEAWQLSAVTERSRREAFFSRVFGVYQAVMFCCGAGIIWLCRPLMLMFRSNFYEAWQFVPLLAIATVFSCFNQFLNTIYVVEKRSTLSLYTMLAGALANCVMNWLMIPVMGPNGATVASFLSYVLVFALRAVNTRGLLRVDFSLLRLSANTLLLLVEAAVMLAQPAGWPVWTTLLTGIVILFNFKGVWSLTKLMGLRLPGQRRHAR